MIVQKLDNGCRREIHFKPAYHKVHDDPHQNYGVGSVAMTMVYIGPKGATHLYFGTGMYLDQTYSWWDARGLMDRHKMHMGYDVGYHSPKPMWEGQQVVHPTKMIKPEGWEQMKPEEYMPLIKYEKIGDTPPICDYLGVPCYCDGSAMRAEKFENIFMAEGDEAIWKMLEEDYKDLFDK